MTTFEKELVLIETNKDEENRVSYYDSAEDLLTNAGGNESTYVRIFDTKSAISRDELDKKIPEMSSGKDIVMLVNESQAILTSPKFATRYLDKAKVSYQIFVSDSIKKDIRDILKIWRRHKKLSLVYSKENRVILSQLVKEELLSICPSLDTDKLFKLEAERVSASTENIISDLRIFTGAKEVLNDLLKSSDSFE
jgi:hypothetical protein